MVQRVLSGMQASTHLEGQGRCISSKKSSLAVGPMLRSFMLKHLLEPRNLDLTSGNVDRTESTQGEILGSIHLQTEACSVLIMYEVHKMSTPPWTSL